VADVTDWIDENPAIRFEEPERRDNEVAQLQNPWIGDEGPLDAAFRRGEAARLRPRGVAFDQLVTVQWDETQVKVVSATPSESGVLALRTPVLLPERFIGPSILYRIDYFHRGRLIASRYVPEGEGYA
jgi:hypothetical protein